MKADVFSFVMAMYELVHRRLILSTILEKHFGSSFEERELALFEYATAVATQGFRWAEGGGRSREEMGPCMEGGDDRGLAVATRGFRWVELRRA